VEGTGRPGENHGGARMDLYIVHSQKSYALKYLLFLHHRGFLRVFLFPPPIKLKATI
jgi:hypothetical protein